mgnify:CR=1 FL=1
MINVKKMDGSLQPYDESKLRNSLAKAGADVQAIAMIISVVNKILYEGIETKKLYDLAFKELKTRKPAIAPRYDLKNAILKLGYGGFAFEKFIARILEKQGYKTILNQIVQGKLITHEVDITAVNETEKLMVECKHHASPWHGCGIQTPLYVYARFLELKEQYSSPMLVTNTKFSEQVTTYSNGVGMRLMGWNYPRENSVSYNIERFKLYPITIMPGLERDKIEQLLNNNVILIRDIVDKKHIVKNILAISGHRMDEMVIQAEALISK